jgi:hypothetical protein
VGSDDTSPVYTYVDDTSGFADATALQYRAVLTYAPGRTVTSDARSVIVRKAAVTQAVVHYNRPDGDYASWGLHLFGDGLAAGEATAKWEEPTPFEGSDGFGALHRIQIANDEIPVGVIVHGMPPNFNTKDTDPNRLFIPLSNPEIWLRLGDGKIYSCEAADSTCVVPSA